MTRAKAITYDNLRLRAPDFVAGRRPDFAGRCAARASTSRSTQPEPPMFQPFRLREMVLANRVVVSPMDMYSAKDGVPGDWHLVHYGSRAIGGAGLVFTEMTCVSPEARITPGCTGPVERRAGGGLEADRRFRPCQFGREDSACSSAMPGRKGATKLMWEGMDRPLEEGAWRVVSASPIPYFPDSQVPREMTPRRHGPDQAREFVAGGASAAERAGFDMLELHCAHGYLLASFISPLTNQPHRRVWRLAREPPALSARGLRRHARGLAGAQADVGAHLGDRLGGGRRHRRRCGRDRRAFAEHGVRPRRRLDRARPCARRGRSTAACSRRRSPTRSATRRGSPRCASATSRRPTRSTPSSPPAAPISSRSAGRIWSTRTSRCRPPPGTARPTSIARRNICAGQRPDLPQLRARPAGSRGAEDQGEAEDAGGIEDGGRRETSRGGMR